MTRVIFAGRQKFRVPETWTTFLWRGRRYRLVGLTVEFWSDIRQGWVPSIRLTTAAPKGRVSA